MAIKETEEFAVTPHLWVNSARRKKRQSFARRSTRRQSVADLLAWIGTMA
jgi:hypothetical protein